MTKRELPPWVRHVGSFVGAVIVIGWLLLAPTFLLGGSWRTFFLLWISVCVLYAALWLLGALLGVLLPNKASARGVIPRALTPEEVAEREAAASLTFAEEERRRRQEARAANASLRFQGIWSAVVETARIFGPMALVLAFFALSLGVTVKGCGDTSGDISQRRAERDAIATEASSRLVESDDRTNDTKPGASTNQEPTYSDPRWPTTDAELLAIPEADRWYNAWKKVDSYGTIAGPVVSVAYLDDRVMVNVGADYPDPDRAQVVIWAERVSDFEDILGEIDHEDTWVSVSGKISEYDGVAEIDVNESRTKWRWTDATQ